MEGICFVVLFKEKILLIKKLGIKKAKSTFDISTFKTDMTKVGSEKS